MRILRDLPLQRKFTWTSMFICLVALFLAGGTLGIYEAMQFRDSLNSKLESLGTILAANSAAPLEFGDPAAGEETLAALIADSQIRAATVYDHEGRLFATYSREDVSVSEIPTQALPPGQYSERGHVQRVMSIVSDGRPIGSIYLEFDQDHLSARLQSYLAVMLMVLLCVGVIAYALSSWLQRIIAAPILDLAEKATLVSDKKDYSVRAERRSHDEVGQLVERFNEMLEQIGQRDAELKRTHDNLEQRVEERTHELRDEVRSRKRVQEELWLAKEAAEQANVAKSVFLANMSHELRTPLNAIIGYSEMLQEDTEQLGQLQLTADLDRIHASGRHLLTLISDVLDLSKIEAGKMEVNPEIFEVDEVIAEVADTIRPLSVQNRNRLDVHCERAGTIEADRRKLSQALLNLLSNANKFTEGGSVTLEVTRHAGDSDELIRFRVSDTGVGVGADQLPKLFSEFTQLDGSKTRTHGGTGLGLAISRRFCRMMGGDILVESELGCGSTFTIQLPVRAGTPEILHADSEELDPEGVLT